MAQSMTTMEELEEEREKIGQKINESQKVSDELGAKLKHAVSVYEESQCPLRSPPSSPTPTPTPTHTQMSVEELPRPHAAGHNGAKTHAEDDNQHGDDVVSIERLQLARSVYDEVLAVSDGRKCGSCCDRRYLPTPTPTPSISPATTPVRQSPAPYAAAAAAYSSASNTPDSLRRAAAGGGPSRFGLSKSHQQQTL